MAHGLQRQDPDRTPLEMSIVRVNAQVFGPQTTISYVSTMTNPSKYGTLRLTDTDIKTSSASNCSATINTLGTALGNTRSHSMSCNNQTTIDMALSAKIVSLCGAATGVQTKVATHKLGNLDDRCDSSKEIPPYIKSTCNNKTTMDMALSAATVDIYSASAEAKAAVQRPRNLEERFKPQSSGIRRRQLSSPRGE
ncbi:hypothetical protein E4T47_04388 [Aureobasidium subglaciale]|nr:hypothetical protein E4T47_04388 [Aureobasidium subglaciale]